MSLFPNKSLVSMVPLAGRRLAGSLYEDDPDYEHLGIDQEFTDGDPLDINQQNLLAQTPQPASEEPKEEEDDGGLFDAIGDIGRGIASGVEGFGRSIIGLADAVTGDGDFISGLDIPDEWSKDRYIDRPTSILGGLAEGFTQFGLGMVPGLGVVSAAGKVGSRVSSINFLNKLGGSTFVKTTAAASVADFTAFQAHEKRLSNLLVENDWLRNPVTEYLAADEGDGEFEGRIKNAVEGGIIGTALAPLIHYGVKAFKYRKRANANPTEANVKAAEDAEQQLGDALDQSGTTTKEGREQAARVAAETGNIEPESVLPVLNPESVPDVVTPKLPGAKELPKPKRLPGAPEEPVSSAGPQALFSSHKITRQLAEAQTVEEMDELATRLVMEHSADARSVDTVLAEMTARLRLMGEDTTDLEKLIMSGQLSDTRAVQNVRDANFAQQLYTAGAVQADMKVSTLSHRYAKQVEEGASPAALHRTQLEIANAQVQFQRYSIQSANIGSALSEGLRSRRFDYFRQFREVMPDDVLKQEADLLNGTQAIRSEMNDIAMKEVDEASVDLRNMDDEIADDAALSDIQGKYDETLKARTNAKEKLEKQLASLEKQLERRRERSAALSGMSPSEIKGKGKTFKEVHPDVLRLKQQIKYHDDALAAERRMIELREEEAYINKLSDKDYTARIEAKKAQAERVRYVKEALDPNKKNSAVNQLQRTLKLKQSEKVRRGKAEKILKELQEDLINGTRATKGKTMPGDAKTDKVLADINDRIKSARAMIKEEGDIEDVLDEIVAITKMSDKEFIATQAAQKQRSALLKQPKKTRLQEVRNARREIIRTREEAMARQGRGFTTQRNFNKWLKGRFGKESGMDKGMETFVKRRLLAEQDATPQERFLLNKKLMEQTGAGKIANSTLRLFQGNLMFGIPTVLLNVTVPLAVRLLKKLERVTGAGLNALRGDDQAMQVFKQSLKFHDDMGSISDAFNLASKSVGRMSDGYTGGRTMMSEDGQLAVGAFDPRVYGKDDGSFLGRMMTTLNKISSLPFTANAFGDTINKTMAGHARLKKSLSVHAYTDPSLKHLGVAEKEAWVNRAMNQAILEDGSLYSEARLLQELTNKARANVLADKSGKLMKDDMAINNEFAKLVNENKDRFIKDQNIKKLLDENEQYVKEVTFTGDPGDIVKWVAEGRRKLPVLYAVLPFLNTPAQILKFGLQRTLPGAAVEKIAPRLLGKTKQARAALDNMTPMQRAEYTGRMTTATAGSAALIYFAWLNKDKVTGSGPSNIDERKALEATGWRPFSFVVGEPGNEKYVSYQRLDPFATLISIAADIVDYKEMHPKDDKGFFETLAGMAFSITEGLTDRSFLRGLNTALQAIKQPSVYGPKLARDVAAGTLIPQFVGQVKDIGETETLIRESRSIADTFMRKLPVADELVPPKRTFLGEAIYKQNPLGLLNIVNPIYISSKKNDIVDKTIQEMVHGFSMPSENYINNKKTDMREFYNIEGRQAYDRYLELSSTITINGKTMRQALKGLIQSRGYKQVTDMINQAGGREALINTDPRIRELSKVITAYRNKAKREMIGEFPELLQTVQQIRQQQQQFTNPIPSL